MAWYDKYAKPETPQDYSSQTNAWWNKYGSYEDIKAFNEQKAQRLQANPVQAVTPASPIEQPKRSVFSRITEAFKTGIASIPSAIGSAKAGIATGMNNVAVEVSNPRQIEAQKFIIKDAENRLRENKTTVWDGSRFVEQPLTPELRKQAEEDIRVAQERLQVLESKENNRNDLSTRLKASGAKDLKRSEEKRQKVIEEYGQAEKWSGQWVANEVMANTPQLLASFGVGVATAVITKNPELALSVGFSTSYVQEAGGAYLEAKEAGINESQAQDLGNAVGVGNALIEQIPLGNFLAKSGATDTVKKSLLRNLKGYLVARAVDGTFEGSTEAMQETLANVAKKTYDENTSLFEGTREAFVVSFILGIFGGAVSGDGIKQSIVDPQSVEQLNQIVEEAIATPKDIRTSQQQEIVNSVVARETDTANVVKEPTPKDIEPLSKPEEEVLKGEPIKPIDENIGDLQRGKRAETAQGQLIQEVEDIINKPFTQESVNRLYEIRDQLPAEQKAQANVGINLAESQGFQNSNPSERIFYHTTESKNIGSIKDGGFSDDPSKVSKRILSKGRGVFLSATEKKAKLWGKDLESPSTLGTKVLGKLKDISSSKDRTLSPEIVSRNEDMIKQIQNEGFVGVEQNGTILVFDPKNVTLVETDTSGSKKPLQKAEGLEVPKETKTIKAEKSVKIEQEKALFEEAKNYKSAEEFIKGQGKPVYHGTASKFDAFDPKFLGYATNANSAKGAFWFTDDPATAKAYAVYASETAPVQRLYAEAEKLEKIAQKSGKDSDWKKYEDLIMEAEDLASYDKTYQRRLDNATVLEAYTDADFLEIDAKGKTPQELSTDEDIDSWLNSKVKEAKNKSKDGLKILNIDDAVGLYNKPSTHYAVFDANKIKTKSQLTEIWNKANADKPKQPKGVPSTKEVKKITPATPKKPETIPTGQGRVKDSAFLERVKDQLLSTDPATYEFDEKSGKYNEMNLEDNAKKAVDFLENNPEEAIAISLGFKENPQGITSLSIGVATMLKAREEGNFNLYKDIATSVTMRATRYGQEIVSLRGQMNDDSPENFVKRVIDTRMKNLAGRLVTSAEFKGRSLVDSKKVATNKINKETKKLKKVLTKEQKKIKLAQDIIDSLRC